MSKRKSRLTSEEKEVQEHCALKFKARELKRTLFDEEPKEQIMLGKREKVATKPEGFQFSTDERKE